MVVVPGTLKAQHASAYFGRRRVGAPGAFILPDQGQGAAEPAVSGVSALPGLLALQEAAEAPATGALQDQAARRHGEAVLQDLTALQVDLLSGRPANLSRLAARAGGGPQAADPRLAGVLGALRLRAEIELARAALRHGSDTENPSPPSC